MSTAKWHYKALPKGLWEMAQALKPCITEQQATLAGGTALALRLGHRLSVDLDFFCTAAVHHERVLGLARKERGEPRILAEDPTSLVLMAGDAKVSFFHHEHPFGDGGHCDGIPVASTLDIAAMKLIAIAQRGLKRDFVDLYCVLQDTPFFKVAERTIERYGRGRVNPVVIGKAMAYFADADQDVDPVYLGGKNIKWATVRTFFQKRVRQFVLDLEG
jgi:predicted nucleotidyltransferase component of viral defense system